jgi:transcriptional regulator with XRE-family HTH domain
VRLRCHLAEHRGKRSISEMSRVSGVQRSYLSLIEAGIRLPSDDELAQIADAYGIPLGAIYEFEPPQYILVEIDPKGDE